MFYLTSIAETKYQTVTLWTEGHGVAYEKD